MMKMVFVTAALGMAAVAMSMQTPQTPQTPQPAGLQVGDKAPDFTLPGSDGKTWKLSELKGKTVVVAWFPKAFTGG
jgi:peroxiredoxin Q/BCP